jgi:ABC-type nitrate/sulfonate/bicarbonate transport system substrate-binding protein
MISRRTLVLFVSLSGLFAVGCGGSSSGGSTSGSALEPLTVQFGYTINGGASPMCNAIVDGDYEAEGLDVHLLPGGPVGATFLNATNAVATNPDVDIAVDNDIVSLIEAKGKSDSAAKGFPVRAFAVLWQKSPLGLIMKADLPLKRIKDAGQPLPDGSHIVFGSTPGAPIWGALAQFAGVSEHDLDIRTIGGDASALIAGKVDAILGFNTEQGVQARQAGIKTRFLPLSEIPGFSQPTFVALAREAMIQDHPDQLSRWLQATVRGAEQTIHNPASSVENLSDPRCAGPNDEPGYERGVLAASGAPYFAYKGSLDRIGAINVQQIRTFTAAYAAARELSRVPPVGELVDLSIQRRERESSAE